MWERSTVRSTPEYFITLVHGTFARHARWAVSGSKFRNYLDDEFKSNEVFVFPWSGGLSFKARFKAAEELRAALRQRLAEYPDAIHYVIAHSHGGTIAVSALSGTELENRIAGLICLSTPFLHVRPRFSGPEKDWMAVGLAYFIIPSLVTMLCGRLILRILPHGYDSSVSIGLLVLFSLLIFLYPRFRRFQKKTANEVYRGIRIAALQSVPLLIVRSAGDEASGLLITGQFGNWILGQLWWIVAAPGRAVERWDKMSQSIQAVLVWLGRGFIAAAMLAGLCKFYSVFAVLACIGAMLRIGPGLLPLFEVLWSLALAVVLLPLMAIVSLTLLPFGVEVALFGSLLEVTAEVAPPGDCCLHQLALVETDALWGILPNSIVTDISTEMLVGNAPSSPWRK